MQTSVSKGSKLALVVLSATSFTLSVLLSGWRENVVSAQTAPPAEPPVPLSSLKTIPIPEPANLGEFVTNREAAIVLGKALFWDMQVGSDGVQACASCHFHAGADSRSKNQLNPGLLRVNTDWAPNPDTTFNLGAPNYQLTPSDFPFHKLADANNRLSTVLFDTNDIASSQGVFNTLFTGINPGHAEEHGDLLSDPVFNVVSDTGLPANVRRVEPRHTPTVINAVFNFRNFWDGRAQNEFNGVNSFGARDPQASVLKSDDPAAFPSPTPISLNNSSLASQAVAPPLSNTEASFDGRSSPDIGGKLLRIKGKKLFSLKPLARQKVSPQDSVLGNYSDTKEKKGLTINYSNLIKAAFRSKWWDSIWIIKTDEDGNRTFIPFPNSENGKLEADEFTLMEWNFSLFFGIAVQMYQSTLVSDDTPLDRFLEGNLSALTAQQRRGLEIFQTNRGRCINCHGGAETTNASVRHVTGKRIFRRSGDAMLNTPITNIFDTGFNPIGVRPVSEDLALGSKDPFGVPLSEARLLTLGLFSDPNLNPAYDPARDKLAVDGAFKTPGLRNIELTAPYFHNGGYLTLSQLVDFYNRGGDFQPIQTRDGLVVPLRNLGLSQLEKDDLVAFLLALTDERVRYQRAPFDHPELFVPNGHPGNQTLVTDDGTGKATDSLMKIPAVGRFGGTPLPNFLSSP
jgi:cytochrome c peroxidase